MMIATARATSGSSGSRAGRTCRNVRIFVSRLNAFPSSTERSEGTSRTRENCEAFSRLNLHDLRFFVPQEVADRLRVIVGQLLHLLLRTTLVVTADVLELLQVMHRVPPNVSHRDLPFLRDLAHALHELLAALLRRLRHREADHLPVVRRRQPAIR